MISAGRSMHHPRQSNSRNMWWKPMSKQNVPTPTTAEVHTARARLSSNSQKPQLSIIVICTKRYKHLEAYIKKTRTLQVIEYISLKQ